MKKAELRKLVELVRDTLGWDPSFCNSTEELDAWYGAEVAINEISVFLEREVIPKFSA
jgi:hypothetical protein